VELCALVLQVALEEYVKIESNIFRVAPGAVDIEEKLSHHRFVQFPVRVPDRC